ncbi:D-isomer specific 2-hydroxyacid dehydrogenase [Talaromyces proteolyticus]|uniref:D-isomer specific 2-hydroxyacid dehydrogenase n=1 Tax=Talaromyces proteolyticus TaxID=1131652 RepID=A0AAD4Q2U1_9EURO|nr:D-isomer specific 2-hydroxyacid dehydrogenase [Talaromyces proteolyticus]KAH8700731.1 D-isomer specific 2-hydroxyacid dehydrogenase [Talaromyces proteolyticus]
MAYTRTGIVCQRQCARLSRTMATTVAPKRLSLAVLDDYLDISHTHFNHIPSEQLSVTVFRDAFPAFGHPQTTQQQKQALIEKLRPFDMISTMRERTPFPGSLLRELPNLKVLLATGTQFETFDLQTANELGITVVAAPGKGRTGGKGLLSATRPQLDIKRGGSHPTTQHTWAMILGLARNIAMDDAVLKTSHGWQTQMAQGLTGMTLGVVGLGRLGAAVARIGVLAWNMKVLCWSQNLTQQKANDKAKEMGLPVLGGGLEQDSARPTFTAVSKQELFQNSDVVSLHYVLSERSRGLVGRQELAWMKDSALLVNTARGPLVDSQALQDALLTHQIAGAALDVFDIEPLPATSPWRSQEWGRNGRSNLLVTPHMGYVENGIMNTWYEETAENVERFLQGQDLLHVINSTQP